MPPTHPTHPPTPSPAVWISRPLHRVGALADELEMRGFQPILRPAIVIRDLPAPPVPDDIHAAVFVSAEAATRQPPLQISIPTFAVGQAVANALNSAFPLAAPPARDAENLLALPALQNVAGKNIAVFGGISADTPTPSPPLCAELVRRGARVFPVAKYRREPAPADNGELARLAQRGILRAATAFSAETLRAMASMADPENRWLCKLPLFVHHPAVAESAAQMHFSDIITDENIADAVARKIQPE